jgi:hypothetical protein
MSVSSSPKGLANAFAFHAAVPASDDPVAQMVLYVPYGYGVNVSRPVGTVLGSATVAGPSADLGSLVTETGSVQVGDPAATQTQQAQCGVQAPLQVWVMNLSAFGQSIQYQIFVQATSGSPETTLGLYKLTICFPPGDVPGGTSGRAPFGLKPTDLRLSLGRAFSPPSAGEYRWRGFFTPYTPGIGQMNAAGSAEAQALVDLPLQLTLQASYLASTNTYTLNGVLARSSQRISGRTIAVYSGTSPSSLMKISTTTTASDGTYAKTGKLASLVTTYFRVKATRNTEQNLSAAGCSQTFTAPCVSATFGTWSTISNVVSVTP